MEFKDDFARHPQAKQLTSKGCGTTFVLTLMAVTTHEECLKGCNHLDLCNSTGTSSAGNSDVIPVVDKCNFHKFGLLRCGCICVRP